MRYEVMKMWTDALRSGKYKKGRSRLCVVKKNNSKKYCCLGVLCDLYNHYNEIKINVGDDPLNSAGHCIRFDGASAMLPSSVVSWAGMKSDGGFFQNSSGGTQALYAINDCPVKKPSFKRMADIIEKNWRNL